MASTFQDRGQSSTKASSRFLLTAGSSTMISSSSAAASRPAEMGRVTNTLQSPRDRMRWYYANRPSAAVPDGLGDEDAIRAIWAGDTAK